MKASDLIHDLRTLIEECGDLEVVNDQDESVMVKFNNDGDEEVFLIS